MLAGAGLATMAALAVSTAPAFAQADTRPCDPFDIDCNPLEHQPPQYVAVGVDVDFDRARDEAEDQAAAHCPGHSFDVVKVRIGAQGNAVKYTLTYICD